MKSEINIIRDYCLGDGYLCKPCNERAMSSFRCTHCGEQINWLNHKRSVFLNMGYEITRKEYFDPRHNKTDYLIYTKNKDLFRELYYRWYELGPRGRMQKNLEKMMGEYPIDWDTFCIWYLDNGHSEIKKYNIRYSDKKRIYCEPWIANMTISCPYYRSELFLEYLKPLGFKAKAVRSGELRSRIAVYDFDSRYLITSKLREFCNKNDIVGDFLHKYNFPLNACPERLNERTPKGDAIV